MKQTVNPDDRINNKPLAELVDKYGHEVIGEAALAA